MSDMDYQDPNITERLLVGGLADGEREEIHDLATTAMRSCNATGRQQTYRRVAITRADSSADSIFAYSGMTDAEIVERASELLEEDVTLAAA